MEQIRNTHFEGERPLFTTHNMQLENVTIHTGESALKECSNIEALNCRFEGKYPFWDVDGFLVKNCTMEDSADLCFEHSTLQAQINSPVYSVKKQVAG